MFCALDLVFLWIPNISENLFLIFWEILGDSSIILWYAACCPYLEIFAGYTRGGDMRCNGPQAEGGRGVQYMMKNIQEAKQQCPSFCEIYQNGRAILKRPANLTDWQRCTPFLLVMSGQKCAINLGTAPLFAIHKFLHQAAGRWYAVAAHLWWQNFNSWPKNICGGKISYRVPFLLCLNLQAGT